jgi:hypothetical protein
LLHKAGSVGFPEERNDARQRDSQHWRGTALPITGATMLTGDSVRAPAINRASVAHSSALKSS